MIIGSILSKFSYLHLSTADNKEFEVKNNFFTRLILKIVGVPHLGFRGRARVVLSQFKNKKNLRILDAGCGYGIYSLILADMGFQVDSIDIDKKRIKTMDKMTKEYPKLRKKIKTRVGSVIHLPYKDGEFDVVICSEVIEHIKDHEKAFSELSRVLSKGGELILTVPSKSKNNQKIYKRFNHLRPGYSLVDIKKIATKKNLIVQEVFYYEYSMGSFLFNVFNKIKNKVMLAGLFYLFYSLYSIDCIIKFGEPNGVVAIIKK